MQYRPLGNTGLKVSTLSFGGSSLGGVFHDINEADGIRAVNVALDHGVNLIDTSPYYGITKAESVLGKALKDIQRDRYYLATKVGQYGDGVFDFSTSRVTKSIDESLARLNVDYVDLIQCHDIEFVDLDQIVNETLPALHKLKSTGKVRHVGITGLPLKVFKAVIDRAPEQVETILSFCHYELNDTSLESLIPYFKQHGVGVINASPTGMGLLTERGTPSWHPASDTIKAGAKRAVDLCKSRGWNIVELAIQFAVAHPDIATTLVGTASSKNMLDNIRYAETPIDPEKMAAVQAALAPIHNFNFTRGLPANRDEVVGMIIDTHVHFWRYTPAEFGWLDGGLAVLRRDYLPVHYHTMRDSLMIDGIVAVQARQSVEETDWLLSLAKEQDYICGVIGWLPLVSTALESMLDTRPVVGLRHVLQAEAEAFFSDAAFNRGLQVLAKRGLAYDLLVSEPQLDATLDLVDRHLDLRFVVDHLAKPELKSGPSDIWRRGMMELGRRENVCCKISGGITEANLRWHPDEMEPYFDVVLEAFSPRRLLFGTNWPVSEAARGHSNWLRAVQAWAEKLTQDENEQLMAKTAARVYRLEDA